MEDKKVDVPLLNEGILSWPSKIRSSQPSYVRCCWETRQKRPPNMRNSPSPMECVCGATVVLYETNSLGPRGYSKQIQTNDAVKVLLSSKCVDTSTYVRPGRSHYRPSPHPPHPPHPSPLHPPPPDPPSLPPHALHPPLAHPALEHPPAPCTSSRTTHRSTVRNAPTRTNTTCPGIINRKWHRFHKGWRVVEVPE